MLCTIFAVGHGIGAALAKQYGRNRSDVALIARTDRVSAQVSDALAGEGVRAAPFIADAGDLASIDHVFSAIRDWGGETDVLIYNAAAMFPAMATELTPEKVMNEMMTNLGGAVASVRATIDSMKTLKTGTILLTGGGLAIEPYPEWASLAAGKAALRAYGLALHKEAVFSGVHVAVIAICGIVETGGPFDPQRIAEIYWRLHCEPKGAFTREVVLLPDGGDPYYNDPSGIYRSTSYPIKAAQN